MTALLIEGSRSDDLDFTDMFCGAGGSSIGLSRAGMTLKLAANHWRRAIETHQTNFPTARHLCEDINRMDKRKLPKTAVLWGSPICTEASPAGGSGGQAKSRQLMLDEEDNEIDQDGYERTRATFWDIIAAAELHRYQYVLVENVVEVTRKWVLFWEWVRCMEVLGYEAQFVSVSSAHVGDDQDNPHAPQWRDRLYIVFNLKGCKAPDVAPRPDAYCHSCGEIVQAYQSWKKPGAPKIGKYGQQYVYRCPNIARCKHALVEPYVLPATAAIDWSDLGTPISERKKTAKKPEGLAPPTIRRIRAGWEMYAQPLLAANGGNTYERPGSGYFRAWPVNDSPMMARTGTAGDGLACPPYMVSSNHSGDDNSRHFLPGTRPLPTATSKIGDGLVIPMVGEYRANSKVRPADGDALNAVTAGGNHSFLTIPPPGAFIQKHHGGMDYRRIEHMLKPLTEPLPSVVGKANVSLVIPYRKGSKAYQVDEQPLSTVATHDAHGLLNGPLDEVDIQQFLFRMLKPREHLNAQRFPADYVVMGTNHEQTMQAGNAVSSNVAQWLGMAVRRAADS